MAQIYGLCSEAIGWLGEEYEETNDAIHIFHYLAENSWKFGINPTAPLEQGLTHHVGIGIQLALNNLYPRIDWPALTAWFSQEYFSRLWIVQEVALAPKIKLFNGPKEISIDTFTVAMRFIQFVLRHKQIGQYWSREYLRSWELIILRAAVKDTEQTEPPTMLDLVVKNATRKCADNHDRIYAMLGLKNHFENSTLKVDYTSNIEQLYQDFALSYLKEGNLKPLHYAGAVIETDPDDYENYWLEATLPTWTPDWRHYYPRTKLCSDHENKPIFSAATAIPPTIIIQQARLPAIGITGRTIDIVEATVATLLDQPWDTRPIKDLGHSTDSNPHMPFSAYFFYVGHLNGIPFDTESEAEIAWPDPSKNKKYPNGEDAETAYARTWMLDNRHPITALTLGDATTMSGRLSAIKSAWKDGKQSIVGPKTGTVFQWHIEQKNITAAVRQTTVGRAFFISKEGWIGLGPVPVRPGDRIVVFEGAETPFVLRKVGSNGDDDGEKTEKKEEWQVLGDAYVHGFMDGEGLSQTYEGSRQVFWVR